MFLFRQRRHQENESQVRHGSPCIIFLVLLWGIIACSQLFPPTCFMTVFSFSPDAFIQVAFQLAYIKVFNPPFSKTYPINRALIF